jgi:hypothetical protein
LLRPTSRASRSTAAARPAARLGWRLSWSWVSCSAPGSAALRIGANFPTDHTARCGTESLCYKVSTPALRPRVEGVALAGQAVRQQVGG